MFVKKSVCPSCSVGCGINLISDKDKVVGTYPYKRHPINEGKNCLRGRDSYKIATENRILTPLVKEQEKLVESGWDSSIEKIASIFKSHSPSEIGILASGNSTNEENKIISEFANSYGIENIGFYSGNVIKHNEDIASYDDINEAKFILLIGDVVKENPLIGRRIMIAKDKGAEIFSCDTKDKTTSSLNSEKYFKYDSISDLFNDFPNEIKDKLNEDAVIVFNKLDNKNELEKIDKIAKEKGSKILPVLKDCNSYGAINYFNAFSKEDLIDLFNKIKVLMIINNDLYSYLDESSLNEINWDNLDSIISIDSSLNESSNKSDIVLPSSSWVEKSGSFTNTTGLIQNFEKIQDPPENVLDDIEIIKKIADKLDINLKSE